MPPLPRFSTTPMRDIAKSYSRRPRSEILAIVDRLEAMIADITLSQVYPLAWVIFRLSGEQHDPMHTPTTLPAEDLLRDLAAMCEHLTAAARLTWDSAVAAGAIDADTLCAKWNVSRKTLERYRRAGLVSRRVIGTNGKPRLVFSPGIIETFERNHATRISVASEFSRIHESLRQRIISRAARYRRRLRCSLNQAAKRISQRYGRSHEAVRQVLRRHDATSSDPIFGRVLAPAARRRRVALRAMARGIEPEVIGRKFGRSRASVVRLVLHERADRLREIEFRDTIRTPTFDAQHSLSSPMARTGLGAPAETDMLRIITAGLSRGTAPSAAEEAARTRAYHVLLAECAKDIANLSMSHLRAHDVDRIETNLRWASRLKAELVRSQIPLAVRTLASQLGTGLDRLRSGDLRDLLLASIHAISSVVDTFDPSRGGRLAAPVGLAVNRVASRWMREHGDLRLHVPTATKRASPRIAGGASLPDWTRTVSPWQAWLEPPVGVRNHLDHVDPRGRDMLMRRHGWGGDPPKTLSEASAALGVTVMRGAIIERAATRAALAAARLHP